MRRVQGGARATVAEGYGGGSAGGRLGVHGGK